MERTGNLKFKDNYAKDIMFVTAKNVQDFGDLLSLEWKRDTSDVIRDKT